MRNLPLLTILFILKSAPAASDLIVSPTCGETVEICEIHLVINYNFTMTKWKMNDIGMMGNFEPVVWKDGELKPAQPCGPKKGLTQCGIHDLSNFSFLNGSSNTVQNELVLVGMRDGVIFKEEKKLIY